MRRVTYLQTGYVLLFAQFIRASAFNRNIGNWDVSAVTRMEYMVRIFTVIRFGRLSVFLRRIIQSKDWQLERGSSNRHVWNGKGSCVSFCARVTYSNVGVDFQVYSAYEFNQYIGEWDVSSVEDMSHMVRDSCWFLLPTHRVKDRTN
jgi:hypothetical protein